MRLWQEAKDFLAKNSKMKDVREASYVIGIEIHQGRIKKVLGLSQRAYIEKVLVRFIMNVYSFTLASIIKRDKLIIN